MSAILSKVLPKTDILNYDELGIYKIIMGMKTPDILNQLHNRYLAPLIEHDQKSGSDYVDFISTYLEYDGHIKDISEKMYVHRNTVHYKIRKIEDMLNCDLSKLDTKTYLLLAIVNYKLTRSSRS